MPGVLLVMTHENAPKQAPFQSKAEDRHARPKPQLDDDKVQYYGQPVALVVAETAETARAAASAIVVTYEKVDDAGLHYCLKGEVKVLPVDTIVVCAGQEPLRELEAGLVAKGIRPHIIGGAKEAGELDAKRAIAEGAELGARL